MQIFITTPGVAHDLMRIAYALPGLFTASSRPFPFQTMTGHATICTGANHRAILGLPTSLLQQKDIRPAQGGQRRYIRPIPLPVRRLCAANQGPKEEAQKRCGRAPPTYECEFCAEREIQTNENLLKNFATDKFIRNFAEQNSNPVQRQTPLLRMDEDRSVRIQQKHPRFH